MSEHARTLLNALIDQVERFPDRKRQVSANFPVFGSADERRACEQVLLDAQQAGSVLVEYGKRETRHLVTKVVLTDIQRLYGFLGRMPLADRLRLAIDRLRAAAPPGVVVGQAVDHIEAAWIAQRRGYGFDLGNEGAVAFLRALAAVIAREPSDRSDMRSYSRKTTGDSKLIENHINPLTRFLRDAGLVPHDCDEREALAILGIEKFPQPVLVAGPISAGGVSCEGMAYVGLPPEAVASLMPTGPVRSVLSVENLASFNRHVREARGDGDVIIYTGGFPSRAALQAIKTAYGWCPDYCFHWGDIDTSGVQIALHIGRATSVQPLPHLMTPDLAMAHGEPAQKQAPAGLGEGTAFATLGAFLASSNARNMEQEELAPVRV